jgi:ribosomal protein S27AE
MTRTANILGILAAALLFLGMFAGLFGGAAQVAKWGTRFYCGNCGYEGEWAGSTCPRCGK